MLRPDNMAGNPIPHSIPLKIPEYKTEYNQLIIQIYFEAFILI